MSSTSPSEQNHSPEPDNSPPQPESGDLTPLSEANSSPTSNLRNTENPLLQFDPKIPFDRIQPEQIYPAVETLLQEGRQTLLEIIQQPILTFENTIIALDKMQQNIRRCALTATHLLNVSHSEALADQMERVEPEIAKFNSQMNTDTELFRVLTEYSTSQEYQSLPESRKAAVDKQIKRMSLAGADLSADQKTQLIDIEEQLATQTRKYNSNLLNSTNEYELIITDEDRLQGLPESALQAARASAEEQGHQGYRFTLQQPSVLAVLQYADDSALREEIHTAYSQRASEPPYDNTPVVLRILELRQQKADLLGKENIAQHILGDRMEDDVETVREMGARLKTRTQEAFDQNVERIKAFQKSVEGPDATLKPWDVSYYLEKLTQTELNFDAEALRPFFTLDNVLQGAFDHAERLFGVTVRPADGYPVPHDSVTVYEMYDSDGKRLGHFYADFIVRDEKQGGAWMESLSSMATLHEDADSNIGVICGNMTAPVDGKPALLTHDEVCTVFHEFGHLLHSVLYRGELASQNGAFVEWDFIEFPSQLMENWCWTKEGLDLFARHHETGELLTESGDLFDKLTESRTFMSAIGFHRQLGRSALDFALHCDYDADTDGDLHSFARDISNQYAAAPSDRENVANYFDHLFYEPVGYACGYYTYRAASIKDADGYERAVENEIFDRDWGERYKGVVCRGGSIFPAREIYEQLMGRAPDEDAMLRREGLLAA